MRRYLLESLAAGVAVLQPRTAAFPELVEATGGGLLAEAGSPKALAQALETLLLDRPRAHELGQKGQAAVRQDFRVGSHDAKHPSGSRERGALNDRNPHD